MIAMPTAWELLRFIAVDWFRRMLGRPDPFLVAQGVKAENEDREAR